MRFPAFSVVVACLTTLLAAFAAPAPARAAEIRITGSDLLLDGALQADLQAYGKSIDRTLRFDLRGSRLGLESLQKGEADIGLLIFGNEDPRPGPAFSSAVIGYLTSVIVVPADVTLTQINFSQLAGVFGARELNNFRRWSEIGALGDWSPRAISGMALRRGQGLSLDIFRYNVLQNPELKPTVTLLDSLAETYQRLQGEEGGIAILPSAPPPGTRLKVLLLAKGSSDVAYPPTPENLHTGDYPLRLQVNVVFRRGEAARYSQLLRRLLSDETAPALQAAGVMPLPVQARNQLVFDLETK
jgi:phosphate transport system substrate-binding protein